VGVVGVIGATIGSHDCEPNEGVSPWLVGKGIRRLLLDGLLNHPALLSLVQFDKQDHARAGAHPHVYSGNQ
jgi:hypothetical protein